MSDKPNYSYAAGRLKYARGVYYRDNLYNNSLKQAEKELNKADDAEKQTDEYKNLVKDMEETKKGFEDYARNKIIENTQSFITRKVKYAKQQGLRFMDRVEKSEKEINEKIEEVWEKFSLDDSNLVKELAELKVFLEQSREEISDFIFSLKNKEIVDKFNDEIDWLKRKQKYAVQQGLRFMDRVEKTHKEINEKIEKLRKEEDKFVKIIGEQKFNESLDAIEEEVLNFENELKRKEQQKELDELIDKLKRRFKYCEDQYPRFLDRCETGIKECEEVFGKIEGNELFWGDESIEKFLVEFSDKLEEFSKKVKFEVLKDAIEKEIYTPKSRMSSAFSELERYGLWQERALGIFNEAKDAFEEIALLHPEFDSHPTFQQFQDKFYEDCDKFQDKYDYTVVFEDAKKKMSSARDRLGFFDSYLVGSPDRALEYLNESKELAEDIRSDPRFMRLKEVEEFLEKFDQDHFEKQKVYDELIIKEEVKRAIENCSQPLGFAETYMKSSMDRALDYFNQSKDAFEDLLSNERFLVREEVEQFIPKFHEQSEKFEKIYNETVLGDEIKKATESALQLLSHANTYFKSHHRSQSLDYFERARDEFREIQQKKQWQSIDKVVQFLEKFRQGQKAFETLYEETILQEEIKENSSSLQQLIDFAFNYFKSHHNSQALEYLEQARSKKIEIQSNPKISKESAIVETLERAKQRISEFEKEYASRVCEGAYKDLSESASQLLSHAKSYFKSDHRSQSLEYLAQAKQKSLELSQDPLLQNEIFLSRIAEFQKKFNEEAIAFEKHYENSVRTEEMKNKINSTLQNLDFADSSLKSEQNARALEQSKDAYQLFEETIDGFECSPNPDDISQLNQFREKFQQRYTDFNERYASQVLGDLVRKSIDHCATLISHAFTYFESGRISQSRDYFEQAKQATSDLNLDDRINRVQQVRDFIEKDFSTKADSYQEKLIDYENEQHMKKLVDNVSSNLSHAKSYFKSDHRSQSLEYLQQASDALEILYQDQIFLNNYKSAQDFIDERQNEIDQFQEEYAEKIFSEEIAKRQGQIKDELSHARSQLDQSKNFSRALNHLRSAKDYADEFASDSRFMQNDKVDDFLENVYEKEYDSISNDIETGMAQENFDKHCATCKQYLSHAKTYHKSHLTNQVLDFLQKARDSIDNLEFDTLSFNRNAAKLLQSQCEKFSSEFRSELEKFSKELEQSIFAERIKQVRQSISDTFHIVEFSSNNHQDQNALEYLEKCREQINDVSQDPNLVGQMSDFIVEINEKIAKFEREYNQRVFAEQIEKALQNIRHQFDQSKAAFAQNSMSRALEYFRTSKEKLDDLRCNESFKGISEVENFVEQYQERLNVFRKEFNNLAQETEVRRIISSIQSNLDIASQQFRGFSVSSALEYYRKACDEFNAIDQRTSEKFSEYCDHRLFRDQRSSIAEKINAFEKSYADSQLKQEVNSFCVEFGRLLNQASKSLNRKLDGNVRKLLDKDIGRDLLGGIQNKLSFYRNFEHFVKHEKQLEQLREKYTAQFLEEKITLSILSMKNSISTNVEKFLKLKLNDQARKNFETAKSKFLDEYYSSQLAESYSKYSKTLQNYFGELQSFYIENFAGFFEKQKFKSTPSSSSAASSSSSSSNDTLSNIIFTFKYFSKENKNASGGNNGDSSGDSNQSSDSVKSVLDIFKNGLSAPISLRVQPLSMGIDVNPSLYSEVKEFNRLIGQVFSQYRKAEREIEKMPWNKSLIQDKSVSSGHFNTFNLFSRSNAGYPIEFMISHTEKLNKIAERAKNQKIPETDKTLCDLLSKASQIDRAWNACHSLYKHATKLGKEISSILATMNQMNNLLGEGKSCYGVNSNPNQIHNGIQTTYDYRVFLEIIASADQLRNKIKRIKSEYCSSFTIDGKGKITLLSSSSSSSDASNGDGGDDDIVKIELNGVFPSEKAVLSKIDKIAGEAKRIHPLHCIKCILYCAGNRLDTRKLYIDALRRFPIARRFVAERLTQMKFKQYERRLEEIEDLDESSWTIRDPYASQTISDAFEENESDYDYPYKIIRPGPNPDEKVKLANRSDQSTSAIWNSIRKQYAGKIVFSKKAIDELVSDDSEFCSEFDGSSDEIFGRCFWERSLANYPLALDRKTNKEIYPPEYIFSSSYGHPNHYFIEFFLHVYVDGKEIKREGQPGNAFTYFRTNGPQKQGKKYRQGSCIDFYSFNQSCRLFISTNQIDDASDDWNTASNRFRRLFKGLSSGKHSVSLELTYRICANHSIEEFNDTSKYFPLHDSPISYPIARGEFTIDCSKPIQLGRIFALRGKTTINRALAPKLENQVVQFLKGSRGWGKRSPKTEHPLFASIEGNWYVCSTDWFEIINSRPLKYIKESTQYGLPVVVYFYRSPQTGWLKESVVAFKLSALGTEQRNPRAQPPFCHVAVGSNHSFDVELLPDEAIEKLIGKLRCPSQLRHSKNYEKILEQSIQFQKNKNFSSSDSSSSSSSAASSSSSSSSAASSSSSSN